MNNASVYAQAVTRLENELGWTESDAEDAIQSYANIRSVSPDDIAEAIVLAPTLARGLGQALHASAALNQSHYAHH